LSQEMPFPRFRAAMRENLDAVEDLPHATFYRYVKGELPANLIWFIQHPRLLRALAEDADTLSEKEIDRLRHTVQRRAKAQKDRRRKTDAGEPERGRKRKTA
jgi:hypothetical protein